LAGYSWLGDKPDEMLAAMARLKGWRVFEAKGWLCPVHAKDHVENTLSRRYPTMCVDCQGHGTRVHPFDITDVQDCSACLGQGFREMNEEEYNEGTWQ
jgi:hypothetical protein